MCEQHILLCAQHPKVITRTRCHCATKGTGVPEPAATYETGHAVGIVYDQVRRVSSSPFSYHRDHQPAPPGNCPKIQERVTNNNVLRHTSGGHLVTPDRPRPPRACAIRGSRAGSPRLAITLPHAFALLATTLLPHALDARSGAPRCGAPTAPAWTRASRSRRPRSASTTVLRSKVSTRGAEPVQRRGDSGSSSRKLVHPCAQRLTASRRGGPSPSTPSNSHPRSSTPPPPSALRPAAISDRFENRLLPPIYTSF